MEIKNNDHLQGPETAPIVLVEYGDYQCPYCGDAYPIIKKLQDHFGDKMLFVYRNFPLVKSHANAMGAALAAEAASRQNQFWKMHDLLYENQNDLEIHDIVSYAESLDLDMERFENDLRRLELSDHIQEDMEAAERSGVAETPSFYINGRRYRGANVFDEMRGYIESLLTGTSPLASL